MESNTIIIAGLAALCMGGLAYGLLYDRISTESTREKRLGTIRKTAPKAASGANQKKDRRSKIQSAVEGIEKQQKSEGKLTFERRLQQAGLEWSKTMYALVSIVCGLVAGACVLAAGGGFVVALIAVVGGFLVLPRLYVNRCRKKRIAAFLNELPNAVDVIVRGIKAGLPLNDCIHIVSRESAEPVRSEFAKVVEAQSAGITIPAAVERMYYRVPLAETNFLSIVITLQSKAGGSMSEALGNLSGVLRDRKKMRGKIQAMSMEAKASAGVIGSLPIVVMSLVYIVAPDYMVTLFVEPLGNILLAGAGVWMMIGVFVMKGMINFDF